MEIRRIKLLFSILCLRVTRKGRLYAKITSKGSCMYRSCRVYIIMWDVFELNNPLSPFAILQTNVGFDGDQVARLR
jgi:hypothetical protein